MRTTVTLLLTALLPTIPVVVTAFMQPAVHDNHALAFADGNHRRRRHLHVTIKPDPMNEAIIDINYAKYCADHAGECSLEDMERIRNALHQERVSHVFTGTDGLHNPHGLIEDIEHKILENDLALQTALRHDALATVHMQEDSMAAYGMTSPYYSSTLNVPTVLDGGLDEESSEALMICVVIAGLALLPQFLGN